MSKVEIYTKFTCGFCFRAKALLKKKNVSFEETDITMGGKKREEMIQRSGGSFTVPQIFIDDRHIGGSDELVALDQSGELDVLLVS